MWLFLILHAVELSAFPRSVILCSFPLVDTSHTDKVAAFTQGDKIVAFRN